MISQASTCHFDQSLPLSRKLLQKPWRNPSFRALFSSNKSLRSNFQNQIRFFFILAGLPVKIRQDYTAVVAQFTWICLSALKFSSFQFGSFLKITFNFLCLFWAEIYFVWTFLTYKKRLSKPLGWTTTSSTLRSRMTWHTFCNPLIGFQLNQARVWWGAMLFWDFSRFSSFEHAEFFRKVHQVSARLISYSGAS